MIDIYLCEDEEIQLLYFKKILEEYLEATHVDARIVSARMNPEQIVADIREHESNLALFFIDIQLKGCSMDGFGLARKLKKMNREYYLVYLTSHEELAYKVFEYELGVLDYIVKSPRHFLSNNISDGLKARLNNIFGKIEKQTRQEKKETLVIECGSRLVEVIVEDIILIQAIKGKHQIEIYTAYQTMNVRQSLKDLYEMLNDDFLYINKSCIVQKSMIREVDKKNRIVMLKGGYQMEISYRIMKSINNIL
ncbi:LytR/AlgR family response regulator transcription factor [Bariatricus sp. SGI.154]|uniref:LytR/AlgR family response regulator transcription factor n=1 Tax=Bariatricus sp. SGI.154 TaxID=3420549 RepID=UPI003D00AE92